MARGYLRAITKGWSVGSIFSVKAGSTVCGIRGSVADIGFNPDTGMATFTSLDGTMFTFPAPSLEMAVSMSINIGTNIAAGRPVMQGMAALANAALQRGDISQADRDAVLSVVSNTSNSDASSLSNNLSGVRMLTAGEAASIDRTGAAGGGGQVITLTQAQRTSLAVASVSKARTQAAKTLAAAGITDAAAETKAEALESRGDTDTVRGAGATGVDAILNSITQELVGSNELNAPASGN